VRLALADPDYLGADLAVTKGFAFVRRWPCTGYRGFSALGPVFQGVSKVFF
jgi:hypothetical protein